MGWRIRGLLLALAALALAAPGRAVAATVSATTASYIDAPGKGIPPVRVKTVSVRLDAAPGETNLVTVDLIQQVLQVKDAGTPPVAGPGCTQATPDTITCGEAPGSGEVVGYVTSASLGNGDDSWLSTTPSTAVDGGPGNDRITTDSGRILGGPGDDVLTATRSASSGGSPPVIDGGPGADRMTGGTVTYAGRTEPITVDLADPGPDGAAGEGDVVTGVTALIGGSGDDTLLGTNGPDNLTGGGGTDHLDGRGGADGLDGAGVLSGGPGNDALVGHRTSTTIRCGAGFDAVRGTSAHLVLTRDCERLEAMPDITVVPRPTVRGRRARLRVLESCGNLIGVWSACGVRAVLRGAGGRLLGIGTAQRSQHGGPFTVVIRLRAHPTAREPLTVRLVLRDRPGSPSSNRRAGAWTVS